MMEVVAPAPGFWREIAAGFRRNLVPGLCLQALALLVVAIEYVAVSGAAPFVYQKF